MKKGCWAVALALAAGGALGCDEQPDLYRDLFAPRENVESVEEAEEAKEFGGYEWDEAPNEKDESADEAAQVEWDAAPEPGTLKKVMVDGIAYNFRYCPAGSFTMGSPESEEGRGELESQRDVTLEQGFWMLETEVTIEMYRSFVEATGHKTESEEVDGVAMRWDNPGCGDVTDKMPVTMVAWEDAVAFCKWLSLETGAKIRLPKETEWEYACRAGSKEAYHFGGSITTTELISSDIVRKKEKRFNYGSSLPLTDEEKAQGREYKVRSYRQGNYIVTEIEIIGRKRKYDNFMDDGAEIWAQVKKYRSNTWNLYEMHGNVREWCDDTYNFANFAKLLDLPYGEDGEPRDGEEKRLGAIRGGDWASHVYECRSARRYFAGTESRDWFTGFRCLAENVPASK